MVGSEGFELSLEVGGIAKVPQFLIDSSRSMDYFYDGSIGDTSKCLFQLSMEQQ